MARVPEELRWSLEELARDMDLLVFKMEQPISTDVAEERRRHRRELERIRDAVSRLTRP